MTDRPERPSDRRRSPGRRDTDQLVDFRLDALEKLPEDLSLAVDKRLGEMRLWMQDWMNDERSARRHHDAQTLASCREMREDMDDAVEALESKVDGNHREALSAVSKLQSETRAEFEKDRSSRRQERQDNLKVLVGGIVSIVVAAIGAYAVIAGAHP